MLTESDSGFFNYLASMRKQYLALFVVSFDIIVGFSNWLTIPVNPADLIHGQTDGYTYDCTLCIRSQGDRLLVKQCTGSIHPCLDNQSHFNSHRSGN